MLRFRADLKTIAFVAIYFGLVAYQWIWAPSTLWLAVPLFVLTCWFSFFGAVATHNTVHSPIWKNRTMNRISQLVLTLTYGHPVSAFVPGHNLSHHKHTQSSRDVMRTYKTRHRWHFLNGLLFMVHVGGDITKADFRYGKAMRTRNPAWFRQLCIEWGVYLGVTIVLLALDWRKFLLYFLIPHQYAAWGIITMNLLQHDGCDENSEYNHSRNFVGKVVNFWTYNNGFHTIHHEEPGLHWSLLPAAHAARIAPHIHENLDQQNILVYLWKTFFWPGKRMRYDGSEFILPPVAADEEWIPAPSETPTDVSLGAVS
ncbi:MAG: fatty acid desaturase [Sandaracinaceae bacterium]|nr:fatty acid desaturase [Sandaracinaceae bacterium]